MINCNRFSLYRIIINIPPETRGTRTLRSILFETGVHIFSPWLIDFLYEKKIETPIAKIRTTIESIMSQNLIMLTSSAFIPVKYSLLSRILPLRIAKQATTPPIRAISPAKSPDNPLSERNRDDSSIIFRIVFRSSKDFDLLFIRVL